MKNSLACVIFKEKKKNQQLFWGSLKNGKIIKKKDVLPESPVCSIVLKANYFWFQNIIKQMIRSLEEKILIIISTDFLTALSLNIFFQSKWWKLSLISWNLVGMMFVNQKQLKFGRIKGVSFFSLIIEILLKVALHIIKI